MSRILRFRSIAEEELATIVVRYESEVGGLGTRFLDEAEHSFENISEFPFMYQSIDTEIRRAMMRNFPYLIFYTIDEEDIIILGCRHMHQNPASWPNV